MTRVLWTPAAETDLDDIWLAIARDRPDAADHLLDRIAEVGAALAEHPRMGLARPELMAGLRSFPVGGYVLFYLVREPDIVIVRVLHGRRDVPGVF